MIKKTSKELKKDHFRIEIPASHIHFFQKGSIVSEIKKLKEDINERNEINIRTIRILDNISLDDNCFSFKLFGEEKETWSIDQGDFHSSFYRKIEDFALEHRQFFS
jgi:flagellar biosynthesis component FlhA